MNKKSNESVPCTEPEVPKKFTEKAETTYSLCSSTVDDIVQLKDLKGLSKDDSKYHNKNYYCANVFSLTNYDYEYAAIKIIIIIIIIMNSNLKVFSAGNTAYGSRAKVCLFGSLNHCVERYKQAGAGLHFI